MTNEHKQHRTARVLYSNCSECRADNERSFVDRKPFKYGHVTEYLAYVRPRLDALQTGKNGGSTVDARWWYKDFLTALNRRISSHIAGRTGRKYSPGYLDRLKIALGGRNPNATYLRSFSNRGASCLDR